MRQVPAESIVLFRILNPADSGHEDVEPFVELVDDADVKTASGRAVGPYPVMRRNSVTSTPDWGWILAPGGLSAVLAAS